MGAFLAVLCNVLIGSRAIRVFQRLLVLPIIQLGHHVLLVAAGALMALFIAASVSPDASKQVVAVIGFGILATLLGGAELQLAEKFAAMTEEQLAKIMPTWLFICINLLLAWLTGFYLIKQLLHVH